MLTLEEFHEHLRSDATLGIDQFLESMDTSRLVPYCVIYDWSNPDETFRINFPQSTEESSREDQYYFLSRLLSQGNYCFIGLVSFVRQNIETPVEIDAKLWNSSCYSALTGVVSPSYQARLQRDYVNSRYESSMIFFNKVDGENVISKVEDMSVWQSFVDNVAVFRDFLYYASHKNSAKPIMRWPELFKVLNKFGFETEFVSEENKTNFILAQPRVPILPV